MDTGHVGRDQGAASFSGLRKLREDQAGVIKMRARSSERLHSLYAKQMARIVEDVVVDQVEHSGWQVGSRILIQEDVMAPQKTT
jgi:hypothetical protein